MKKENGSKGGDYRGVTLASTLYKIYLCSLYAEVLAGKIREEVLTGKIRKMEGKLLVPDQAGFRKKKKMMDNIYIVNYIVSKNLSRKESAFFINLKAVFDKVDRKILLRAMKETGVRKELIRCGDLFQETKSKIQAE